MSLQLDPDTERFIRSTPRLSSDRIRELLATVAAGGDDAASARDAVIQGAVWLAISLASEIPTRLDPDDVAAEAMVAVCEAVDAYDGDRGEFSTLLAVCIKGRLIAADPGPPLDSLEGFDRAVDAPEPDETRIVKRKIGDAVYRLTPVQRTCILRRYGLLEDYEPQGMVDIAHALDVLPPAVSKATARGRDNLRRLLADLDPAA